MMNGYGALFDLDGVLIDTEPIYTEIWEDIDAHYPSGIPGFALKIKGTTLSDILARYYPDPEVCAGVENLLREHEENMSYPLISGVEPFLQMLQENNIPAAIVTSSNDKKMAGLFRSVPRLKDYFRVIVTDGMVTHSKPHPEPYLKGAALLNLSPNRCVVFEDSYNGLRSGRAAGCKVVALATSNPAETLVELSDRVINDFTGYSITQMLELFSD